MHAAGFYHGSLQRSRSVLIGPDGRLWMDNLERACRLPLPLGIREGAVGWDLRGFLRGLSESTSQDDVRGLLDHYRGDLDLSRVQKHVLEWVAQWKQ